MASASNIGVTARATGVNGREAMARAVRAGAQPSFASMVAVNIQRLPDISDLDIAPIPTEFTQDVSDIIGDFGTEQDGFETLLSGMELSIAGDAAGLADTIGILDGITDIDFESFDANNLEPLNTVLADATKSGDSQLDTFNTTIVPPTANTPPTPPNPVGPPGSTPPGNCKDVNCFADPTNPCCAGIIVIGGGGPKDNPPPPQ